MRLLPRRWHRGALAAAVLITAGALGGPTAAAPDPSTPPESSSSWLPAAADEPTFTPAADTSRIIPASGDLAEVVYALGFGDHVVATDISATYPPEAAAAPKIGYQRTLNAESLLAHEPTLVVTDDRAGPPEVFELLRSADVEVVTIPYHADIHAPAYKIRAVAAVLDAEAAGEQLVAEFEDQLAAAEAIVSESPDRPLVMALYLRGTAVQLVFGDESGIDAVIEAAGGADGGTALDITGNGELSTEAIVDVAPDYFLVTTTGLDSVGGVDGLLEIPGLADTPAGQNRAVLVFEDQYLYGLGPRTGALVVDLATAFHTRIDSDTSAPPESALPSSTPPNSPGEAP